MTTDSPRKARPHGVAALGVAVLAASTGASAVVLAGAFAGGSTAAVGALVGAGVTLLVLATGFAVVDLVAGLMPAASLMVALLTYTLQLLLLVLLLIALRRAEDVERTLDPAWFAAGVITVSLVWTVCLVVHQMRARIPLYDLPDETAQETTQETAQETTSRTTEGSDR